MSLSCSDSLSALLTAAAPLSFGLSLVAGEGAAVALADGVAVGAADDSALVAFFSSSSFCFFFSCFARSSAFVSLVKTIVLLSGDHTGLPAPCGKSVNEHEPPPAI